MGEVRIDVWLDNERGRMASDRAYQTNHTIYWRSTRDLKLLILKMKVLKLDTVGNAGILVSPAIIVRVAHAKITAICWNR